jgi:hypothetical protein
MLKSIRGIPGNILEFPFTGQGLVSHAYVALLCFDSKARPTRVFSQLNQQGFPSCETREGSSSNRSW